MKHIVKRIKDALTDELRLPAFRNNPNRLVGHCYIASEALYYITDKSLKPMFIKHEGQSHWFLKDKQNRIIDITASQFNTHVPYNKAVGKGFLTNKPSKRAQILIKRVTNHAK